MDLPLFRAWNEQRALVPQTHSLDGAELEVAKTPILRKIHCKHEGSVGFTVQNG